MRTDPTDNGGLFVARRPGTKPVHYAEPPTPGSARRQRRDTVLAARHPRPDDRSSTCCSGARSPSAGCGSSRTSRSSPTRIFFALVVAFVGDPADADGRARRCSSGSTARGSSCAARPASTSASGVIGRVFMYTAIIGASLFGLWMIFGGGLADSLNPPPTELMGLLDHYKQFEELPDEEVSARLREDADERRRKALARVDELDLSRTTWPEYPPSAVVNAITFVARAGLHRYTEGSSELRTELALRHDVEPERVASATAPRSCWPPPRRRCSSPATSSSRRGPPTRSTRSWRGAPAARSSRSTGSASTRCSRRSPTARGCSSLCNPNDPTGELLPAAEVRRLLDALPERVVGAARRGAARLRRRRGARRRARRCCEDYPRLLVFRSFSKAWGLAGLRCGYAVGGPGAEPLLDELGPPLGIGELAQAGVLEALRHGAAGDRAPHAPRRGRARAPARRRCATLPLEVTPTQANVVWLRGAGAGRRRARGAPRPPARARAAPAARSATRATCARRSRTSRDGPAAARARARARLTRAASLARGLLRRRGVRAVVVLGGRLAQQRAGRLLEDPAPGPRLLLLAREVLDDLAHARGGDLDAVAAEDLLVGARSPRRASASPTGSRGGRSRRAR